VFSSQELKPLVYKTRGAFANAASATVAVSCYVLPRGEREEGRREERWWRVESGDDVLMLCWVQKVRIEEIGKVELPILRSLRKGKSRLELEHTRAREAELRAKQNRPATWVSLSGPCNAPFLTEHQRSYKR